MNFPEPRRHRNPPSIRVIDPDGTRSIEIPFHIGIIG